MRVDRAELLGQQRVGQRVYRFGNQRPDLRHGLGRLVDEPGLNLHHLLPDRRKGVRLPDRDRRLRHVTRAQGGERGYQYLDLLGIGTALLRHEDGDGLVRLGRLPAGVGRSGYRFLGQHFLGVCFPGVCYLGLRFLAQVGVCCGFFGGFGFGLLFGCGLRFGCLGLFCFLCLGFRLVGQVRLGVRLVGGWLLGIRDLCRGLWFLGLWFLGLWFLGLGFLGCGFGLFGVVGFGDGFLVDLGFGFALLFG